MSSRGHRRNPHRWRRGGGLLLFFLERPFLLDRSRRGPPVANPPGAPSSDEEVHSYDKIFREIEDYAMEAKRKEQVQASDPPYMCLHWTFGGRMESVRLGALSFQPVEPHPRTLTRDISTTQSF